MRALLVPSEASWSEALAHERVIVNMPRRIENRRSPRPALQRVGVRLAFRPEADCGGGVTDDRQGPS